MLPQSVVQSICKSLMIEENHQTFSRNAYQYGKWKMTCLVSSWASLEFLQSTTLQSSKMLSLACNFGSNLRASICGLWQFILHIDVASQKQRVFVQGALRDRSLYNFAEAWGQLFAAGVRPFYCLPHTVSEGRQDHVVWNVAHVLPWIWLEDVGMDSAVCSSGCSAMILEPPQMVEEASWRSTRTVWRLGISQHLRLAGCKRQAMPATALNQKWEKRKKYDRQMK